MHMCFQVVCVIKRSVTNVHARIEKGLSGGSNSDKVVFVRFRGARLQRPPKVDNYRPASETPLKWRFTGGPIMAYR